jgi:hypothetical protein
MITKDIGDPNGGLLSRDSKDLIGTHLKESFERATLEAAIFDAARKTVCEEIEHALMRDPPHK